MVLFLSVYCRAFEAQDYAEAEQQCQAALAVDPLHQRVNKEMQLLLCRVQQSLDKPQDAVEVSQQAVISYVTSVCNMLHDTTMLRWAESHVTVQVLNGERCHSSYLYLEFCFKSPPASAYLKCLILVIISPAL
jgi:hypothetical protein